MLPERAGTRRVQDLPAVDNERLTGDPARAVGSQKLDGVADVGRLADPAERRDTGDLSLVVLPQRLGEARTDDAGRNRVDPDLRREFKRELPGDVNQRRLRHGVDPEIRAYREASDRCRVDHRPAVLGHPGPPGKLGPEDWR